MKKLIILAPFLLTLISFGCQKALVRDYQAANPEEQAIKELIMQREAADHRGDKTFFERKMLDDGQFWIWLEGKWRESTRAEWFGRWEYTDKELRDAVFKDLKILELGGDTAVVTYWVETPRWWVEAKHTLKKIDGQWYFAKTEYTRKSW